MATAWSKLTVSLGLDTTGFQSQMTKVGGMFRRFGSSLAGQMAGAFALGAVVSRLREMIRVGKETAELSENFGISATNVYRMGQAAELAHLSMGDLENLFTKIFKTMGDTGGAKKMATIFGLLGMNIEEVIRLDPGQQLERLVEALGKAEPSPALVNALADIAGRSGPQLLHIAKEMQNLRGGLLGDFDPSMLAEADRAFIRLNQDFNTLVGAAGIHLTALIKAAKEVGTLKTIGALVSFAGMGVGPMGRTGLGRVRKEFLDAYALATEPVEGNAANKMLTGRVNELLAEQDKLLEKIIESSQELEDLQWKNATRSLPVEQQKLKTRERINQLLQAAGNIEAQEGVTLESLKLRKEVAQLEGQILGMALKEPKLTRELFKADQLARIGGQISGAGVTQSWRGDIRAIRDMLFRKGIKIYGEL